MLEDTSADIRKQIAERNRLRLQGTVVRSMYMYMYMYMYMHMYMYTYTYMYCSTVDYQI